MHANTKTAAKASARSRPGSVLTLWRPEDKQFWEREGEAIARINLWISVPALFLAFAIWQVWSVVAVNLPALGFTYSTNQLFWLAAAPALSGATLRIFYSFMVPLMGGRRWTALSTASLLIPAIGIGYAVQDASTGYPTMLILALLCGLGGGNFSSSMANISFFFPKERKGSALGVNAGLGNLGVSVVQFLSPLVITAGIFGVCRRRCADHHQGRRDHPGVGAERGLHLGAVDRHRLAGRLVRHERHRRCQGQLRGPGRHLPAQAQLGDVPAVPGHLRLVHRLCSRLSAADQEPVPGTVNPLAYAWLGPLLGALSRPFGGWLADKAGGARVTFWNFLVMAVAVVGVLYFLPKGSGGYALGFGPAEGSFMGFFLMFLVLFLTTGIGNGSTFSMIPAIFLALKQRELGAHPSEQAQAHALKEGNTEGAAALGFAGALGAYGGFFIPKSYGSSIAATGGPELALWVFAAFYVLCVGVTWWYYARRNAEMPC